LFFASVLVRPAAFRTTLLPRPSYPIVVVAIHRCRCSSQCSPPSPRARRLTSDDQASRRTRPAPTPVPTSGGPASQSVADPSESAHRGQTTQPQRLRRLVHVMKHGRHRRPALSDSHDCSSFLRATGSALPPDRRASRAGRPVTGELDRDRSRCERGCLHQAKRSTDRAPCAPTYG